MTSKPKVSYMAGLIGCKCPRCRQGKVFKKPMLSTGFYETNDTCSHCGIVFEHETGFYWAAMYISYALSTGLMLSIGLTGILLDWDFSTILITIISIVIVCTPLAFRYSRMLLLYTISPNRKYNPNL